MLPSFYTGIVGLNNIKANDYMNVVLHVRTMSHACHMTITCPLITQALAHISPIRDFFLKEESYAHIVPPPGDQKFVVGEFDRV